MVGCAVIFRNIRNSGTITLRAAAIPQPKHPKIVRSAEEGFLAQPLLADARPHSLPQQFCLNQSIIAGALVLSYLVEVLSNILGKWPWIAAR
jgi:hypothetical protein